MVMRAWRNLKEGDLVQFVGVNEAYSDVCIVTAVSENRAIARTAAGIEFWIDDDTRDLFRAKEAQRNVDQRTGS